MEADVKPPDKNAKEDYDHVEMPALPGQSVFPYTKSSELGSHGASPVAFEFASAVQTCPLSNLNGHQKSLRPDAANYSESSKNTESQDDGDTFLTNGETFNHFEIPKTLRAAWEKTSSKDEVSREMSFGGMSHASGLSGNTDRTFRKIKSELNIKSGDGPNPGKRVSESCRNIGKVEIGSSGARGWRPFDKKKSDRLGDERNNKRKSLFKRLVTSSGFFSESTPATTGRERSKSLIKRITNSGDVSAGLNTYLNRKNIKRPPKKVGTASTPLSGAPTPDMFKSNAANELSGVCKRERSLITIHNTFDFLYPKPDLTTLEYTDEAYATLKLFRQDNEDKIISKQWKKRLTRIIFTMGTRIAPFVDMTIDIAVVVVHWPTPQSITILFFIFLPYFALLFYLSKLSEESWTPPKLQKQPTRESASINNKSMTDKDDLFKLYTTMQQNSNDEHSENNQISPTRNSLVCEQLETIADEESFYADIYGSPSNQLMSTTNKRKRLKRKIVYKLKKIIKGIYNCSLSFKKLFKTILLLLYFEALLLTRYFFSDPTDFRTYSYLRFRGLADTLFESFPNIILAIHLLVTQELHEETSSEEHLEQILVLIVAIFAALCAICYQLVKIHKSASIQTGGSMRKYLFALQDLANHHLHAPFGFISECENTFNREIICKELGLSPSASAEIGVACSKNSALHSLKIARIFRPTDTHEVTFAFAAAAAMIYAFVKADHCPEVLDFSNNFTGNYVESLRTSNAEKKVEYTEKMTDILHQFGKLFVGLHQHFNSSSIKRELRCLNLSNNILPFESIQNLATTLEKKSQENEIRMMSQNDQRNDDFSRSNSRILQPSLSFIEGIRQQQGLPNPKTRKTALQKFGGKIGNFTNKALGGNQKKILKHSESIILMSNCGLQAECMRSLSEGLNVAGSVAILDISKNKKIGKTGINQLLKIRSLVTLNCNRTCPKVQAQEDHTIRKSFGRSDTGILNNTKKRSMSRFQATKEEDEFPQPRNSILRRFSRQLIPGTFGGGGVARSSERSIHNAITEDEEGEALPVPMQRRPSISMFSTKIFSSSKSTVVNKIQDQPPQEKLQSTSEKAIGGDSSKNVLRLPESRGIKRSASLISASMQSIQDFGKKLWDTRGGLNEKKKTLDATPESNPSPNANHPIEFPIIERNNKILKSFSIVEISPSTKMELIHNDDYHSKKTIDSKIDDTISTIKKKEIEPSIFGDDDNKIIKKLSSYHHDYEVNIITDPLTRTLKQSMVTSSQPLSNNPSLLPDQYRGYSLSSQNNPSLLPDQYRRFSLSSQNNPSLLPDQYRRFSLHSSIHGESTNQLYPQRAKNMKYSLNSSIVPQSEPSLLIKRTFQPPSELSDDYSETKKKKRVSEPTKNFFKKLSLSKNPRLLDRQLRKVDDESIQQKGYFGLLSLESIKKTFSSPQGSWKIKKSLDNNDKKKSRFSFSYNKSNNQSFDESSSNESIDLNQSKIKGTFNNMKDKMNILKRSSSPCLTAKDEKKDKESSCGSVLKEDDKISSNSRQIGKRAFGSLLDPFHSNARKHQPSRSLNIGRSESPVQETNNNNKDKDLPVFQKNFSMPKENFMNNMSFFSIMGKPKQIVRKSDLTGDASLKTKDSTFNEPTAAQIVLNVACLTLRRLYIAHNFLLPEDIDLKWEKYYFCQLQVLDLSYNRVGRICPDIMDNLYECGAPLIVLGCRETGISCMYFQRMNLSRFPYLKALACGGANPMWTESESLEMILNLVVDLPLLTILSFAVGDNGTKKDQAKKLKLAEERLEIIIFLTCGNVFEDLIKVKNWDYLDMAGRISPLLASDIKQFAVGAVYYGSKDADSTEARAHVLESCLDSELVTIFI